MKKIKLGFISILSLIALLGASPEASSQTINAKLKITVLDDLGNLIEGAQVKIYASEDDYKASENAVATSTTDKKGRVKIKELQGKVYFVQVTKGDLKNDGRAVQTNTLTKGTNRVNIIIE